MTQRRSGQVSLLAWAELSSWQMYNMPPSWMHAVQLCSSCCSTEYLVAQARPEAVQLCIYCHGDSADSYCCRRCCVAAATAAAPAAASARPPLHTAAPRATSSATAHTVDLQRSRTGASWPEGNDGPDAPVEGVGPDGVRQGRSLEHQLQQLLASSC
jgi:hypothetical protein